MQEVSLEEIHAAALSQHKNGRDWHFHILSPTCTLNTNDSYAFILETENEQTFVYYSAVPENELGAELSPLLHKPDSKRDQDQSISASQADIIDIAKHLSEHGINWHHHVLFQNCRFNEQTGKFCLVLENPETGEVHKAISDTEPRLAINQLEPLFYAQ